MRENKISVIIDRPAHDVFEFTINPKNTPRWTDSIVKEEANEKKVRLGTKYRNVNKRGVWSSYTVTKLVADRLFELKQENSTYHVRYSYEKVSEGRTRLTYFEWVETGDLEEPFQEEVLNRLKECLESR